MSDCNGKDPVEILALALSLAAIATGGKKGQQGNTGPAGPQGPAGSTGAAGAPGATGATGPGSLGTGTWDNLNIGLVTNSYFPVIGVPAFTIAAAPTTGASRVISNGSYTAIHVSINVDAPVGVGNNMSVNVWRQVGSLGWNKIITSIVTLGTTAIVASGTTASAGGLDDQLTVELVSTLAVPTSVAQQITLTLM